jgi:hypothetical protein
MMLESAMLLLVAAGMVDAVLGADGFGEEIPETIETGVELILVVVADVQGGSNAVPDTGGDCPKERLRVKSLHCGATGSSLWTSRKVLAPRRATEMSFVTSA